METIVVFLTPITMESYLLTILTEHVKFMTYAQLLSDWIVFAMNSCITWHQM
jgi:hypothetical protein